MCELPIYLLILILQRTQKMKCMGEENTSNYEIQTRDWRPQNNDSAGYSWNGILDFNGEGKMPKWKKLISGI